MHSPLAVRFRLAAAMSLRPIEVFNWIDYPGLQEEV